MKKLLSLVVVSTLVVSLFGCGSKSSSPKEEAAQGVTDTEVVIANCAATSGAFAPVGVPFLAGIEAYLKYVNDNGGVNGRTVKFIHQDDEFDPIKGKACVQKMIEDEKVFALVGHFGTPVVGATLEDIKDAGIPAVYFATGIGQLYNDKALGRDRGIFPVQPVYKTEGQIMVARLTSNFNAKKIGVIYTNDDAGKDLLWGAEKMAKDLGVSIVSQQVTAGSADVSAAVTALKQENVDGVIIAAIQATFPTVVKELAAQGNTAPAITTYVNVSKAMVDAIGGANTGYFDIYGNGWVSFEGDRMNSLKLYGDWIVKVNGGDQYTANAYAMTGWIAAYYFVEGLKRVEGTITWDKYMDALESAPIDNPFGGTIDYTDGKRLGTQEMNLSVMDPTQPTGWGVYDGLKSIRTLLGK